MEALKTARAETSRLRSEYAKRRLEMKEFHDEQHRGVLRERTNEKTARGALRESQRQGLMDEMARLRKAAAVQESWLKVSIGSLGAAPVLSRILLSAVDHLGVMISSSRVHLEHLDVERWFSRLPPANL